MSNSWHPWGVNEIGGSSRWAWVSSALGDTVGLRTFRLRIDLLCCLSVLQLLPLAARAEVVYLYDPCISSNERGVTVAKQDIADGKLRINLYWGAAPIPPSKKEVQETTLRVKLLEGYGIEAKSRMASDIADCASRPYETAYQAEMKRAIETKHGKDFWRRIDEKVKKALGRKLVTTTDEIT